MTRPSAQALFSFTRQVGFATLAVVALASICLAQPVAPSALKAAFTLNFVKFAEWPELKPGLPILVCVLDDESIMAAMTQAMSGYAVGGRAVRVVRRASGEALGDCQLLFVSAKEPQGFAAAIEQAGRSPTLTVSDIGQSATRGAMIEFFVDGGRLRFAINAERMERSRIKISSRLLALAKIVRDPDTR